MSVIPEPSTTTIWVNARFLDRPVTGVERVARELLGAFASRFLDEDGCWLDDGRRYRLQLIAPRSSSAESPWPNVTLRRAGVFQGHAWEQLDLPWLTRDQWLLSLCNTGPLFKRRHLLYLHDAQPFAIPENFSLSFRLWYKLMFHVAGRTCRHILVNSQFTAQELNRCVGLSASKMTLCYPGSEHIRRAKINANALSRFDLPAQPFLLAVASGNPNKNFAAVVRALDELGDAAPPCVIVGRTNQQQFGGVTLDLKRVTHLGYVSDEELLALYKQALCLVFPSIYEGFGLPPLEAMTAGCPVIAANTSAMPEIGGNAVQYCDPADHYSLAHALRRVSQSAARRRRLSEAGQWRACVFSWQGSAHTLQKLIQETAGPRLRASLKPARINH